MLKISLCLNLINFLGHWDITSFFTIELGGFVSFSWNYSTTSMEAVSKKRVLLGWW